MSSKICLFLQNILTNDKLLKAFLVLQQLQFSTETEKSFFLLSYFQYGNTTTF